MTPTGKYCCMPQCNSCSLQKIHMYTVPTGKGKRFGVSTKNWADNFYQVLFKYRNCKDFRSRVLSGNAHICEKHFSTHDIQKNLKRSWIKPGTVPTINLPEKSHPSPPTKERRTIYRHPLPECEPLSHTEQAGNLISLSQIIRQFKQLKKSIWRMHEVSKTQVHFNFFADPHFHATSSISLLVSEKTTAELKYSCAYNGIYVPLLSDQLSEQCKSIHQICKFLQKFRNCEGYNSVTNSQIWKCVPRMVHCQPFEKRYISENCKLLVSGCDKICVECMKQHVTQSDSEKRHKRRLDKVACTPLSKYAPVTKCSKKRLEASVVAHRKRIQDLEKEFHEKGLHLDENLSCIIENVSDQDEFCREWWIVQKKLQSVTSKHNRRYPPSIVRYCLNLYAMSPAAYKLLQKVLILPSPRKLRSERCGAYKPGLQESVVNRVATAVQNAQKDCDKLAVLTFDEMTIREDIAFCSNTGQIVGFVEFANDTLNFVSNHKGQVATHMLAFFLRGITNDKLDGVVAFYPTSSVNSSELFFVLTKLLVEVPCQTGCTIMGLVFDGLAANRSVMHLLANRDDDVLHRMKNPVDTSKWIYFIPDPPHVLKTCRNNLISSKKQLWNGGEIYMEPIKHLIREDLARGELRFFHKLQETHINPSPWEKMSVSIAAQTLSRTVGLAMKKRGYHALSEFIINIDRWFDCMNAGFQKSNFKDARKPYCNVSDERLVWLTSTFVPYLKQWKNNAISRPLFGDVDRRKMVLSEPTEQGLIVSSMAMVAIIRDVLDAGAKYVLGRKINQDPLEAYFGHQRQRGWRNENPNVSLFASNAKNLDILKSGAIHHANVSLEE